MRVFEIQVYVLDRFVRGKERGGVRCDGFDEFDRGWLEHVLLKGTVCCLFIHSKGFFSFFLFDYFTYIHT